MRLNNAVAALFYAEKNTEEYMQHDFDTIVEIIKNEKPAELEIFIKWFKNMFYDRPDLVEKINDIQEVKTMLKTYVEKYGKKILKEGIEKGIEKGKLDTARNLLKENMPVKKISAVTGLSAAQIEKLKK